MNQRKGIYYANVLYYFGRKLYNYYGKWGMGNGEALYEVNGEW
jgi:hypothetical protein